MRGVQRTVPRSRPSCGLARVSADGPRPARRRRCRHLARRARVLAHEVGRQDLHGHRRPRPRARRAGDGATARRHPRLSRTAGAAAGRAFRAGAGRAGCARGGGILPRVSHIYVYSPSSAVPDRSVIHRGVKRLEALGHEVELDSAVFARKMRFAGDDEIRLAAIHRAAESGADIALITRGGYGLTRLLPAIRYKTLAKASDRGMSFVGHSDFTALQCAVLAETGRVTWSGPALGEDFGGEGEPDDIMQACFEDLASGQGEGAGWQLAKKESPDRPFTAQGMLWGG